MFAGKKIVVVMPAYNAAQTLRKTYEEVMAQGVVDRVIVVDDASRDETVALARTLPDATVTITGVGVDAEAVATVGGNGVITGIVNVIDAIEKQKQEQAA